MDNELTLKEIVVTVCLFSAIGLAIGQIIWCMTK
jgi:hypothetical protein